MTTMEERVSRLEGAYEQVDQRLGDLTEALRRIDARIEAARVESAARHENLEARLNSRLNTLTITVATVGVGLFGGLVAIILRI